MFTRRTTWDSRPNPLTLAWNRRLASGQPAFDLTQSNPTVCGFHYPPVLIQALADPRGLLYQPEPRGLLSAREAAARYLAGLDRWAARRGDNPDRTVAGAIDRAQVAGGVDHTVAGAIDRAQVAGGAPPDSVDPGSLLLSASTSEAYGWLLKLLCEEGDEVLVPRPSYPLLEYLAHLEDVVLRPYTLRYDGRWNLDRSALEDALSPRTRAVMVVHPNNPTGNLLSQREASILRTFCAEHGLALISDEVFLEYPLPEAEQRGLDDSESSEPKPTGSMPPVSGSRGSRDSGQAAAESPAGSLAVDSPCLAFSLGGLSKACGLPQIKAGWIRIGGPEGLAAEAMARLEIVADTYLSVNTPAQVALPVLLESGRAVGHQIRQRTAANWIWLCRRADESQGSTWSLLYAQAGWYAVLRVPHTLGEEEWCLRLAEEAGVLLHPGYFFDFPGEAYLVASLLPPQEEFRQAMELVFAWLRSQG